MEFNSADSTADYSFIDLKVWDAHVHIWSADAFLALQKAGEQYGVQRFMGIAQPDIKKALIDSENDEKITFGYYLPIDAFAKHEPQRIIDAIEEAHSEEYSIVKMWFGPRFLDYFEAEKPFSINAPIYHSVFELIEDHQIPIDIHVADPDIWYDTKYKDVKRYRTKNQAMEEFRDVLQTFSKLKVISVHFNSLPEHLTDLSKDLDDFPNLFIDTASTKWMIRELGKDIVASRKFFMKYHKRILFATDLSVGWEERSVHYLTSRYWAQRLFWESDYQGVELPFSDSDNPDPPTYINGLGLPNYVLRDFYWENAYRFFS
jgi:predicted TIM-barrel fold metal-dependent hydrolase